MEPGRQNLRGPVKTAAAAATRPAGPPAARAAPPARLPPRGI